MQILCRDGELAEINQLRGTARIRRTATARQQAPLRQTGAAKNAAVWSRKPAGRAARA